MKVWFLHDRILTIWWAEKVFFDLIKTTDFDEAEIFTVFSDQKELEVNWKKIKINALISNSFLIKKIGYRNFMPIFPLLMKLLSYKIKKYSPDKLVISSFTIAKNVDFKWKKELYLHSPMQYIRDSYTEYIQKFTGFIKFVYIRVSKYLRIRDKKYTQFDKVYFNSKYTQTLAKKIYWIEWKILYPKIDKIFIDLSARLVPENYFVYIGRLVKYSKEVDKIIKLFNENWENLIIIWDGPDAEYLKSIAQNNIVFIWYLDKENNQKEKDTFIKILKKSKWFVNITKESFGITTSECLALWIPVFGYAYWGSAELVEQDSWILVKQKDLQTLIEQFEIFKGRDFDRAKIKENFLKQYLEKIKY